MNKTLLCLLMMFLILNTASAQSKGYVLQNTWSNTLNPYNPTPFYEQVFSMLERRLKVKEIERNPLSNKVNVEEDQVKETILKHIKENTQGAYYITLSSDLSLPLINLTRIIFKSPTRSSRFVFTVNVYNNKAEKVFGDTIVNKGCVLQVINEDKKDFYPDYDTFKKDMRCHFEAIRKQLEKK